MSKFVVAAFADGHMAVSIENSLDEAAHLALAVAGCETPIAGSQCTMAASVAIVADESSGDFARNRQAVGIAWRWAQSASPGQVLVCEQCFDNLCAGPLPEITVAYLGDFLATDNFETLRVYQLGDRDGPKAYPPIDEIKRPLNNLGRRSFPFFGRGSEIQKLIEALESHRVITITGEPGIGKSSLAWRIGLELRNQFPSGVWHLPVSYEANFDGLLHDLANIVRKNDGQTNPAVDLKSAFAGGPALVILDDCDRSKAAATRLAQTVVGDHPALAMILTSRFPVGVPEESIFHLGPMVVPSPLAIVGDHDDAEFDALDLLLDRVERLWGKSKEDLPLSAVIDICRLTSGNPSQIIFASYQIASRGPIEALAEFRSDHQHKLASHVHAHARSAFGQVERICACLPPATRLAAAKLSVLCDRWTAATAASIVSANDLDEAQAVLAELCAAGLVEVHLTHESQPRYSISGHIFSFLQSVLGPGDRIEADQGRIRHYLHFVKKHAGLLNGDRLSDALGAIDNEYQNILSVIGICLAKSADETVAFVSALAPYLQRRRPLSEWQDLAAAAIEIALRGDDADCARTLNFACTGKFYAQAYDDASELARRALTMAERCKDPVAEAMALSNLSFIEQCRGQVSSSLGHVTRAIEILRGHYEPRRLAACLINRGAILEGLGQPEEAIKSYAEAVVLARALSDRFAESRAMSNLAELLLIQGDRVEARAMFARSLEASVDLGDMVTVAFCAEGVGMSLGEDRASISSRLLGFARQLRETYGFEPTPNWNMSLEATRHELSNALGEQRAIADEQSGSEMDLNDAVRIAREESE